MASQEREYVAKHNFLSRTEPYWVETPSPKGFQLKG